MNIIFIFIYIIINLVQTSITVQFNNNALSDSAFIWQGFNHKWERKILGFLTPHRMGSIGNRIINQKFEENQISADIEIEFTPGVNGDWAFPSTPFTLVYNNKSGYENIKFSSSSISFNFTDEALKNSKHPHSETYLKHSFMIPTYNFKSTEILLNGFHIDMKCIDSKCNSNGIWPSKFIMNIVNCQSISENSTQCELEFVLNRGWTPLEGGLKSFNYKMAYEVQIEILAIHSDYRNSIKDFIELKSNIHKGEIKSYRQLEIENLTGDFEDIIPVTGITGFGFELEKYKNLENLGRYIEEFKFEVGNTKLENGKINYLAFTNINSATYTVLQSDVNYYLNTNTFLLEGKNVKNLREKGVVCRSDWTTVFFCGTKGLEDKNQEIINYKFSLE